MYFLVIRKARYTYLYVHTEIKYLVNIFLYDDMLKCHIAEKFRLELVFAFLMLF